MSAVTVTPQGILGNESNERRKKKKLVGVCLFAEE